MVMTFRGHALYWFMKFSVVPAGNPQKIIVEIQTGLVDEFRKPKSKLKCITELKQIKQIPSDSI